MKKLLIAFLLFIGLDSISQVPQDTAALRAFINAHVTSNHLQQNTGANLNSVLNAQQNFAAQVAGQTADYVISISGTTITAQPNSSKPWLARISGTDAFTVIQATITAVSDTGHIHISRGTYNLTDELVITGKGSSFVPYRSLLFEGDGYSTQLIQNTSGKNGIVIKNRAGVNMRNLFISCGSSANSALLLDNSGTSEVSVYQSNFDYLYLSAASSTLPALFAKNFWYSTFSDINAVNVNSDAIVLQNASSSNVHYGNSHFGKIYVVGSESTGFAGLRINTGAGGSAGFLDHCTFDNFQDGDLGDYGIYVGTAVNFHFNMIDIEGFHHPVALGQGGGRTRQFTFDNAFTITAGAGDTALVIGSTNSGSNTFNNYRILGFDNTTIPIVDKLTASSEGANRYDIWLDQTLNSALINIAWASNTPITIRSANGTNTTLGGTVSSTVFSASTSTTTPLINGSTLAGGTLTLHATTNGTKGKILFGTASTYNEVNDRLGIGTVFLGGRFTWF